MSSAAVRSRFEAGKALRRQGFQELPLSLEYGLNLPLGEATSGDRAGPDWHSCTRHPAIGNEPCRVHDVQGIYCTAWVNSHPLILFDVVGVEAQHLRKPC